MELFPYEWVAVGQFTIITVAALVLRTPGRAAALGVAALGSAVIVAGTFAPGDLRAWLAHLYLIGGYWAPALLVQASGPSRFEAWLARTDRALRPRLPALPPWLAVVTEIAYLLCYPLVPASFLVVWRLGTAEDLTRFWVATLLSGYACYITLPWLVSRPPRRLEASEAPRGVRALNAFVLDRVSHAWNTFPSGHVAVSCAAAWSVAQISVPAGAAIGLAAAAVAAGAAAGRYHYVIDVIAGVLVAAVVAVITW